MCFMERATLTTAVVEEWRPVVGYEGLYEVSNFGRVRSLDRIIKRRKNGNIVYKGMILKLQIKKKTRYGIILTKNHTTRNFMVHRLVAEAFIPNPKHLETINHKDENPFNNNVNNLEWMTNSENLLYGTRTERIKKKIQKKVEKLTKDFEHIEYYDSLTDAAIKNNAHISNISNAIHGKYKTCVGYIWRMVDK